MKRFLSKGKEAELAQRSDRNTPTLAPETSYCLPDSRFAMMMRLARMGASDRMFRRKIKGIDSLTIAVLRRLVAGQQGQAAPAEDEPGVRAG